MGFGFNKSSSKQVQIPGQSAAADKQRDFTNMVGQGFENYAQGEHNKLVPGYTSLMDSGYLSPEEEAAATTSEMGSAMQPFESAGFEADNRAARTNNAADLTAGQDELALEKGRTAGDAAAKLQEQKMQNQLAGMYGLSNIEGNDMHAMESMYGLGPQELQARAAGTGANSKSFGFDVKLPTPHGFG